MKILILTDKMDIGGAETHIYELSRALVALGHQVKILAGDGQTAKLLSIQKVEFESTCVFERLSMFPLQAVRKLATVIRTFKPDVVHAHTRRTLFTANIVATVIPFPLVFTAHAKFSVAWSKRIFTKPPHNTIAVSEDIKKHFNSFFGTKHITVIENGIDSNKFTPCPKTPQCLKILNVSRLDRNTSKTAELLCHIALRLRQSFPDIIIEIVGDGNDFKRIAELAQDTNRKAGKDIIFCRGTKNDVLPFLQSASLFVGVSRSALEAVFSGLPAIICGNEGYFGLCAENNFEDCTLENFCARSCPPPTAEKLLSDILSVLNVLEKSRPSHALRKQLQKRYDAAVMGEKTQKVYKEAFARFNNSQKYDAVICGYYGFGNLGDEMILDRIKKELSSKRTAVIGVGGNGQIGRTEIFSAIKAIRSSRLFILGGGSLLQNSTSRRSLYYYLTLLHIASFFGKKTMLYANGLGPITGSKAIKKCKRALSVVDVASFRDKSSLAFGKKLLGKNTLCYLTCDPALYLRQHKKTLNRILFFIRGEDFGKELAAQIKQALLRFNVSTQTRYDVIFASMNENADSFSAVELSKLMPFDAEYKSFTQIKELIDCIASSTIILSGRLHALISAASVGRPFIAICCDPKLKAFANECELSDKICVSLENDDFGDKLFEALKYTLKNQEQISTQLLKKVKELSELSKRDVTEIYSMLNAAQNFKNN